MADAPTSITVGGEQPYDVVVGHHLLGELARLLGERVRKVLVVHPGVLTPSAEAVRDDLVGQGYQVFLAEVPEAEDGKTAEVAAFCWHVLGQADFTRGDAVVAPPPRPTWRGSSPPPGCAASGWSAAAPPG